MSSSGCWSGRRVAAHPELAAGLAAARVVRGIETEVADLIGSGRARLVDLPPRRAARARVLLDLTAGALARLRGDWDGAVALYRSAPVDPVVLNRLGIAEAEIVPVLVHNFLGMAALLDGDLVAAERDLHAATSVDLATPPLSQLNAATYLTLLQCERGELDAAERAALDLVRTAGESGLERAPQIVAAYLAMAWIALDRADPEEVDEWLGRIAAVEAVTPEPHVQIGAALLLAARRAMTGDREPALSGLRAVASEIDAAPLPRAVQERLALAEATLLAGLGDGPRARAILDRLTPPRSAPAVRASARLLLLLGDGAGAAAARARAGPADHPRGRVDLALLDTALALTADDEETALDRIEEALAVAGPWSLRRPFLGAVPDLAGLLERRVQRGTVVPGFAVDLLERMSGEPVVAPEARRALVDPLTGRERTVLRYLASTLSNAEIAAELYVSVNTVKTHERSLYRKLGVANRRAAVGRARALDLL